MFPANRLNALRTPTPNSTTRNARAENFDRALDTQHRTGSPASGRSLSPYMQQFSSSPPRKPAIQKKDGSISYPSAHPPATLAGMMSPILPGTVADPAVIYPITLTGNELLRRNGFTQDQIGNIERQGGQKAVDALAWHLPQLSDDGFDRSNVYSMANRYEGDQAIRNAVKYGDALRERNFTNQQIAALVSNRGSEAMIQNLVRITQDDSAVTPAEAGQYPQADTLSHLWVFPPQDD